MVEDIFAKAEGDIEVIAVLDGPTPHPLPTARPKLKLITHPAPIGMRAAINSAAAIATGNYLLKSDAHCMFAQGFDLALKADCDKDWVVIPRRYSLDAENWQINPTRPYRDYHYLCFPAPDKRHDMGMHGVEWPERTRLRQDTKYLIDDNMSFQGSCWFMTAAWFNNFLHGLDENPIYGGWAQEPVEIGNKTWLGGGRVIVNKKTWYAHLHKGRHYGRMYPRPASDEANIIAGHNYSASYWMNNQWPDRKHDISWLIEKFWPVPTWPEDRLKWVSPI
jgi:hypothetical protein